MLSRRPAGVAASVLAVGALAVSGAIGQATRWTAVSSAEVVRPRVTNRCPTDALPLRHADLPALRRFGLELVPHGVQMAGSQSIDYREGALPDLLHRRRSFGVPEAVCRACDRAHS